MTHSLTPRRHLRAADLEERLGVSRATLWRWRRAGKLPAPVRLGPNVVAWLLDEIVAWEASLPRT